jgi:GR25 family glycosyltransferase involved in LPS biosynthesis
MNDLPEDYDVFSIYVDENQFPRYNQKYHVGDRISKGYQDWSTLCYVVSKAGAEKLCRYVEETGMDMPTDWFIFRHGDNGIFNVYTLNPKVKNPVAIDKKYLSQVQ